LKLKTSIIFKGTLSEIVSDLETWKKKDAIRAKAIMKAPAALKITVCNYPVKTNRVTAISAQRTIWPEEADKIPELIANALVE